MKKNLILVIFVGIVITGIFYLSACVVTEGNNQPPKVELLSPVNESTEQELDVMLEWDGQPGQAAGASRGESLTILGYLVYFAVADQAYGAPEPVLSKELEKAGLSYGTRYKWKVEVVQSDGQHTCSHESFFNTKNVQNEPPQVELISPTDSVTDQATTVTMTWEATPGRQLNDSIRAVSIEGFFVYFAKQGEEYPEPQWTTSSQIQESNLEYNATYKWKVEVVQSDGQKATSTERTFSTVEMIGIPQIELLSPTDFAIEQATSLTLTWEATPGAQISGERASITRYDVYFAKSSERYSSAEHVTSKELQKSNLEYGTEYKWKVVAIQSDGKSAASEQKAFTTAGEKYTAPEVDLNSPSDNATGVATTLTLTWEATAGTLSNTESRSASIEGYLVYFGKSSESYPEPRWTTNSQIQESNLEYNTTYKWKVTVLQSDGQLITSTEWTFGTIQEYGAPQIELVSPADFATDQATSVTLTWEASPGADTSGARAVSITGYDVYFAKASEAYGSPEEAANKELQKSNLEYGTLYKWKVVAKQSDGKSATSEQSVFTTVEESYNLPQIALQNPCREATMVSLNPTLTWEATPGTQSNASARSVSIQNYEVYFAKVGEDYASSVILEEKSLGKVNLDPYTEYKWKVAVHQSDGQDATTPEATFLTAYTFLMGNTLNSPEGFSEEKPVHGVVFTYEFEIGKYEVTFDHYDAYCDAKGLGKPGDEGWGRGSRPVINVNWYDAVKYCNWLSDQVGLPKAYSETTWELLDASGAPTTDITQVKGWRLPTEAEWEYCARGGAADITDGVENNDYLYAGSDTLDDVGWYNGNSDTGEGWQSHPVGEKEANELGLYDMSGNVYEWCHDRWGFYSSGTQTNPTGPDSGDVRMLRGGCWGLSALRHRVAYRDFYTATLIASDFGFRLARTR